MWVETFLVLATESVVGGRALRGILREQSRVYSLPVGSGKYLLLSAVPTHWKENSYHLISGCLMGQGDYNLFVKRRMGLSLIQGVLDDGNLV